MALNVELFEKCVIKINMRIIASWSVLKCTTYAVNLFQRLNLFLEYVQYVQYSELANKQALVMFYMPIVTSELN